MREFITLLGLTATAYLLLQPHPQPPPTITPPPPGAASTVDEGPLPVVDPDPPTTLAEAFRAEALTNKPVLIYHTSPTCRYCLVQDRVHQTPEVQEYLQQHFTFLKLDITQENPFQIRRVPLHLLVVNGKEVARISWHSDWKTYLAILDNLRKEHL